MSRSQILFGASVLAVLLIACAVSLLVVGWVKRNALRLGLIDLPNERKVHTIPIPRGGGLGIWLGVLSVFALGTLAVALAKAHRAGPACEPSGTDPWNVVQARFDLAAARRRLSGRFAGAYGRSLWARLEGAYRGGICSRRRSRLWTETPIDRLHRSALVDPDPEHFLDRHADQLLQYARQPGRPERRGRSDRLGNACADALELA